MRFNICKKKCNFIFTNLLILFFILLFFYYYYNYKYILKENFLQQGVATHIVAFRRKIIDFYRYNKFVRSREMERRRLQNNN